MKENNKKIQKRGLRLSTAEGNTAEKNRRYRMKIANMVKRKPEIRKYCCICGKNDAEILHNKKNPYFITFLCKECRADKNNLEKAEKTRFDIREVMDKSKLSTKHFLEKDVKKLVEDYLMEISSIGAYCEKIGISRHQFNQLVERYKDMYNDISINKKIINHANKVNREKLSKLAIERNRFSNNVKYY